MNNISLQSLLIIASILGLYTNILVYLAKMGLISLAPFYFVIFLGIISVCVIMPPFLLKRQIPRYFSTTVICWILFYLLISLIWSIPSDMPEIVSSIFLKRVLAILAFSVFLFIFSGSDNLQTWARRTLLLCVCLAIFNNIYEFLMPFSFVPMASEYANPGRSAGFYVNANLSGSAVVLGMIFTVGLFPPKYRGAYVLSVLLAVLLTFSRGALVEWFLVILIFIKVHILRKQAFLFLILGFGFLLYILLPHFLDFIIGQEGINSTSIIERLDWIYNPSKLEDYASSERKYIANLSWKSFMDSPFWGHGIGSTRTWGIPTHKN